MYYSSIALATLTPLALVTPTSLAFPIDAGLAIFMPLHMMVGVRSIIEDYVPKSAQDVSQGILFVATGATVAGLLGLSLTEKGLGGTVIELWKK